MGRFANFIVATERWSFFIFAIICVLGSFVHLNILFNDAKCDDATATALLISESQIANGTTIKVHCIGRNLLWLESKPVAVDSNEFYWRGVFTLEPSNFVEIWTPFFLSFLALFQHFKGWKSDVISGNILKVLLFEVFWILFGVIGYAANWGVIVGLTGILWLGVLDLLMMFLAGAEEPVLQFDLGALSGRIKTRRFGRGGNAVPEGQQQQQPSQLHQEDQEIGNNFAAEQYERPGQFTDQ